MGISSFHSVPSVLVTVTKLLAKNTPFTKENLNNSFAKGELSALARSGKSRLPLTSSLLVMNFMVAGFGVGSTYTLIVEVISCSYCPIISDKVQRCLFH